MRIRAKLGIPALVSALGVVAMACGAPKERTVLAQRPADPDASVRAPAASLDLDPPVEGRRDVHPLMDACEGEPRPKCDDDCVLFVDRDRPSYSGDIRLDGRPFAPGSFFEQGSVRVRRGEPEALADFFHEVSSAQFHVRGYLELSKLRLFPRLPIVRDGWIHVLATRLASVSSVDKGMLAPEIVFPEWFRPASPLRANDFKVPCGSFSLTNAPYVKPAGATPGYRLTEGAPIPLSRQPSGPVLGHITVPAGQLIFAGWLQQARGQTYVVVGDDTVELVGWIPSSRLVEAGTGFGRVSSLGGGHSHVVHDVLRCRNVPLWVRTRGKTWEVIRIVGTATLEGALTSTGDFRVDLGVDPVWTREPRPEAEHEGALDPFVASEYLVRCTSSAAPGTPRH